jgi:hypothetical protein
VPLTEPIDLLNVAFENPRKIDAQNASDSNGLTKRQRRSGVKHPNLNRKQSDEADPYRVPDRIGGLEELEELRRLCPGRVWNFVRSLTGFCPELN